jgi:hypothetical protein
MARETNQARRWYLAALIGFAAGLVIGLIIAWGVWPVSYKNALPQDLRAAERDQYLTMVALSLAATGDGQAAQERLQTWPTEDLAAAMANLQERLLATDPNAADAVQQLAASMNLGAAVPQPASGAAPVWKSLCTSGLWVLLILIGVAALTYLFRRWRAARTRQTGPAIAGAPQTPPPPRSPDEIARSEKDEWPYQPAGQPAAGATLPGDERESYLYGSEEAYGEELPAPPSSPPEPMPYVAPPAEPSRRVPAAGAVAAVTATAAAAPAFGKVGDFMAVFQMGEPAYDEAFDINDPTDGYMGQCGLQLNEPVGRSRDQAVALQAWLWDSSDPDTRTVVLMSEGAYRDTAMRSEQAGEHDVLQVRGGTEFELESHDLLLRGKVEKVDYIDQEPNRGVLAGLQVRMQVYRKA